MLILREDYINRVVQIISPVNKGDKGHAEYANK